MVDGFWKDAGSFSPLLLKRCWEICVGGEGPERGDERSDRSFRSLRGREYLLLVDLEIGWRVNAYILANGSPILRPVRVPVRAVSGSLFAFAATLLPTASILLAVGHFPFFLLIPRPPRRL